MCFWSWYLYKVFRSRFLEPDSIGIVPTRGYRLADNQSEISIKWLCLVEEELGIEVQHVGRGREALIDGVGSVDGIFDKTILEFMGCDRHLIHPSSTSITPHLSLDPPPLSLPSSSVTSLLRLCHSTHHLSTPPLSYHHSTSATSYLPPHNSTS